MKSTYATFLAIAFLLAAFGQSMSGQEPTVASDVTAIDVLLAPDVVMIGHAKAANARLRVAYPNGFELDAIHNPHITVIQRFVRTADLGKVNAAIATVMKDENPSSWEMKATGYYDIPVEKLGVAGIVIEPTKDLLRFQQKVIDAVAPFTVEKGTESSFAPRPDGKPIEQLQPMIDYVSAFVPMSSGRNYNPHVTIGVGNREFLDKLKVEPFKAFTFRARSVDVYQLGEFGTAQKRLWSSADPLPSWNEGAAKKSILAFDEMVTKEGGKDFVPVAERIAVFDDDGTLWRENPMPFQAAYVFDELKRRAPKEPQLAEDPMVKATLAGNLSEQLEGDHHDGLMQIASLTHAGMTTGEFKASVETWLATAKHPKFDKPYDCAGPAPIGKPSASV